MRQGKHYRIGKSGNYWHTNISKPVDLGALDALMSQTARVVAA